MTLTVYDAIDGIIDPCTIEMLCCLLDDATLMRVHKEILDCERDGEISYAKSMRKAIWPYLAERVNGAKPE